MAAADLNENVLTDLQDMRGKAAVSLSPYPDRTGDEIYQRLAANGFEAQFLAANCHWPRWGAFFVEFWSTPLILLFLPVALSNLAGSHLMRTTMQRTWAVTILFLVFAFAMRAQDGIPTLKAEAVGAFVWGEDIPSGAVSSNIRDPVTGNAIHKLSRAGIEVSSRVGFEKIGAGQIGELLVFTTVIVNNTHSGLSVRQGIASVDGYLALPLSVVLTKKGLGRRAGKEAWELARLNCFSSGFFPKDNFFSSNAALNNFTVAPNTGLTVSFVTKDPRSYSVLCSVEGCYPKGVMRFSVIVNAMEFVFVWPGRAVVYCGK